MKKLVSLIVALMVLCSTVACYAAALPEGWKDVRDGVTGLEPAPTTKEKIVVGYTPSAMNSCHEIVIFGFEQMVEDLGLQDKIELIVQAPSGQSAVEEQVNIVETFIEQGVDVICCAPSAGSDEALLTVYEKAAGLGIPVFEFNTPASGSMSPHMIANVGHDQTEAAKLMGEWVVNYANGADLNVMMEEGMPGIHASSRTEGFLAGIAGHDNIHMVVTESAEDWSVDDAMADVESALIAHPEIQLIWAQYDELALGIYTVLTTNGRNDIKVCGFECLEAAYDSILHDEMAATIDNGPKQQGRNLCQAVVDYAMNGKTVGKIVGQESKVLDSSNVKDYDVNEFYKTSTFSHK